MYKYMQLIKVVTFILGAIWFFPISCTTGIVIGTKVFAKLDERHIEKGEELHSLFNVVYLSENDDIAFKVINYSELLTLKDNVSFHMPKAKGSIELAGAKISYQVLEANGAEQIIEVIEAYEDGDKTIWSRYKVSENGLVPISSRMFYFCEGPEENRRIVMIEFPDISRAKEFYFSEEYTSAIALRKDAADFELIAINGIA